MGVPSMRILFICVGNTCRSQMAEGLAREQGLDAASAGTNSGGPVASEAINVLAELGIDISQQHSKSVDRFDDGDFDKVISMGCGVSCPSMRIDEDWALDDPYGQPVETYRMVRDKISTRLSELLAD